MTAERRFQTPAQCRAVDRRDYRFCGRFHRVQRGTQCRFFWRLAKLGDVRACDKSAAIATEHYRLNRRIAQRFCNAIFQALADVPA